MSEWALVYLVPLKIFASLLFTTCYVIGGRKWKFIRRIAGPVLFVALCVLISLISKSFSWWYLVAFIPLFVALRMGYGADEEIAKLIQRLTYGFVLGMSGLCVGIISGHIFVGLAQLIIAMTASVLLGVFNPTNAVDEEALISVFSVILIPFMV